MAHEKDISAERQAEFDQALMMEAMSRADLGVGAVWEPTCGGKRSAALFIEGVASFATVEPEMDVLSGLAAKNGVKEPAIHFVFSFSPDESVTLTAEQKINAARDALYEMGLRDHAKYLTLHIDKPHHHVHCAVAATSSKTLLAWERNRDQFRISHACRTVEIAYGYRNDPGLYMARVHADGTKTIELATLDERLARKAERQQDQLENRVRRTLGDYASFETAESWKETVIARLHEHADKYRDAGIEPFWADAHLLAAEWNGRLRRDEEGGLHLDLWERIPDDEIGTRTVIDEHGEAAVIPGLTMRPAGASLPIARAELPFAGKFVDLDAAETDFEKRLRADPTIVGRALTDVEGRGMWSRADVDAFVHRRHSDVVTATDLADHVLERDKTIVMTTADASRPMYVRLAQRSLEQRVVERADRMAAASAKHFDTARFERAIGRFEKRAGYDLTPEQRALVHAISANRFTWANGEAGSGKTTSMRATAEVAAELGVPIVGLATSKAAAQKLEAETGIKSYTLARAMVGKQPVITKGAWVIVDETSMSSYKALDAIGALIERAGGKMIGIGDGAQIPSIEGGSPHDALCGVAQRTETYVELREVWRQKRGPLAFLASNPKAATEEERLGLIARTGAAIRAGDEAGVERFVHEIAAHGLLEQCDDRDAVVRAAAAWYVATKDPTLLACKDRETVKHTNGAIRELLGLTGTGEQFRLGRSGRETRELAVGDRVQFLRNSQPGEIRNGSVANNDLGTVRAMTRSMGRWTIEVDVDALEQRPAKTVRFDPKTYNRVEHGYVVTSHKSQGQEFKRAGWIWDKTSDANMAHVNVSRAVEDARGFYSKLDFKAVDNLATHLGQRIVLKDDVQLLYRTIEKTGGKDTAWARNAIAALQRENDPLRVQYVRECQADQNTYVMQMAAMHTKTQTMRLDATSPADEKAATKWHSEQAAALGASLKRPPSLAEWLVANKTRLEAEAEVADRAQQQRAANDIAKEHALEQEQVRAQTVAAQRVVEVRRAAAIEPDPEQKKSRGMRR
jgi:ATP-dependent exoDNAse (exonuclease V) alpha subunit